MVLVLVLLVHCLFLSFGETDAAQKGFTFGLLGGAKAWWPVYNPVGFFATFLLGVLSAGLPDLLQGSILIRDKKYISDVVVTSAIIGALLLLWFARNFSYLAPLSFPKQPYYFPYFPFLIAIILAFTPFAHYTKLFFDNAIFRFISTISYGLYLWHYLILELLHLYWNFYTTNFHLSEWLFFIFIAYNLALILSILSWHFIEKPIVKWSHKVSLG